MKTSAPLCKNLIAICAAALLAASPAMSASGGSGEWVEVKGENEYQNKKTTQLILAAEKGDTAAVERQLASGADVNAQAMRKEYVDRGNGSGGVEYIPETEKSALMAAAEKGHLAVVEKLLAAGANVNAHARYPEVEDSYMYDKGAGMTALVFALKNGQSAVAERLLAAGANANDGGHEGCKPESSSCGHSPYPLGLAAARGDAKMVDALLQHKADPSTGLGSAASAGRTEMVKLLLDKGAKVDKSTDCGTPLSCAVSGGGLYEEGCSSSQTEIVRLLLSKGANPNVSYPSYADDFEGEETVLQIAKRKRCTQIVKLLQSAGAGKKGAKKRK